MDRSSLNQDLEAADNSHEEGAADAEHQPQAVASTQPQSGAAIESHDPAVASSVEGPHEAAGGVGGVEAPSNAVTAIDGKVSAARTKMWDKNENARTKAQKARIKGRATGKEWTEEGLAKIQTKEGAQGVLVQLNTHKTAQGIALLKTANKWDPMIATLPPGGLNAYARRALGFMVADGLLTIDDCKTLFYYRFKIKAEEAGQAWSLDNMQSVWKTLDVLPAQDVTKNTMITVMHSTGDQGGGTYSDSGKAIDLGQNINGDYENLEATVRHEIGHGVHAEIEGQVNPWLQNDMGFWYTTDFAQWVKMLGGFPKEFTNSAGTKVAFDAAWQTAVVSMIDNYTGSSSWTPVGAAPTDGQAPDLVAAYNAMPVTVKNAVKQSTANWYNNYENFQAKDGKHFFLNHWYHRAYWIGPNAMKTIPATNDKYSAMSEYEFFANCYSEYFRDPSGVKHPANWGGNLNGGVKSFMHDVVLKRQPYSKFQKSHRKKMT